MISGRFGLAAAVLSSISTCLASQNSDKFYLFSIVSEQETSIQYSQVQLSSSNELVLSTDSDKLKNFEGSIWKNGYLNEVNNGYKVVVIDEKSKKLKVDKQPGAGEFSVKDKLVNLAGNTNFVACHDNDDSYFTLHTSDYNCKGNSYTINLRPNLVDKIRALDSYTPTETDSSQFNATSFTTSLSLSSSSTSTLASSSLSSLSILSSLSSLSASSTSSTSSTSSSSTPSTATPSTSTPSTSTSSTSSPSPSSSSTAPTSFTAPTSLESPSTQPASTTTNIHTSSTPFIPQSTSTPSITSQITSTSGASFVSATGTFQNSANIHQTTLYSISVYDEDGQEETSTYSLVTFVGAGISIGDYHQAAVGAFKNLILGLMLVYLISVLC